MLEHLIDHKWSDSKLYLILCGSSMSFMENQVLGQKSPLYGRRTGQFKIEPLNYKESAVFHPELPYTENALIYGITGGIPHYINKLNVKSDVDEAFLTNLFDRSSYLHEEPANLLKQEGRESAIYSAIIKVIAEGASHLKKCVKTILLYYADQLPINLSKLGQWRGTDPKKKKQVEIDIVGTSAEGKEYIIGSCKYRNEKIGVDIERK